MTVDPARIRTIRHESPAGAWELVLCRPAPALAPYVRDYHGYREARYVPLRRIEITTPAVVVIVNFGPDWRLGDGRAPDRLERHGSFAAGLYSTYAISENTGAAHCLQFNLTPVGARLVLGLPLHLLTDRIVDLADLLGAEGRRLEARLAEAANWRARFALLDSFIAARVAAAAPLSAFLLQAWGRLDRCGGRIPVGAIASELDMSRKHLSVRFREEIGLPPRTVARLMRFRRVVEGLSAGRKARWSEIALEAGYCDQAHLIRDFRRFAGMTPTDFARRRLADGSGVIDDLGLA